MNICQPDELIGIKELWKIIAFGFLIINKLAF